MTVLVNGGLGGARMTGVGVGGKGVSDFVVFIYFKCMHIDML